VLSWTVGGTGVRLLPRHQGGPSRRFCGVRKTSRRAGAWSADAIDHGKAMLSSGPRSSFPLRIRSLILMEAEACDIPFPAPGLVIVRVLGAR
jgi:hypothetical protein